MIAQITAFKQMLMRDLAEIMVRETDLEMIKSGGYITQNFYSKQ